MTNNVLDNAAGYRAYARYQGFAEASRQTYIATRATVWADICTACVRLSLTEAR